jgi:hypothetical protein
MLATTALGVASVGVAIGAAAIKVTEWSIEIERLRAQMQFAFAGGEAQAIATAQAIGGVAVESVVKLQTTLKASGAEGKITVEALQGIANAATAMGKTGDDALTAFADALRSGIDRGAQDGRRVDQRRSRDQEVRARYGQDDRHAVGGRALAGGLERGHGRGAESGAGWHRRARKAGQSAVGACQQHDGLQVGVVRAWSPGRWSRSSRT